MTRYAKTMTEALAEVQYNSSKLQEATIDMLDHDKTDPDFQKLIKKFKLKAKDLKGDDGTSVTGSVKDIEKMLNTMYGKDWKDMYQQKGQKFVELEQVERESVQEAASTGAGKNSDSVAQDKTDGLAPNAKKELDRAVKEPGVDAEKSNKLNFASFKKMTKKSKDN